MVMKNRDKQNTSKPNHHPKMACKTAGLRRQCEVWVCIAAAQRGANKPSFSIGSTWKREDFPGFGVDMHWNCGCFYTISIYIPKFHSRICENISSARWNMMEQLGNIETACTDFIRFQCQMPSLPLLNFLASTCPFFVRKGVKVSLTKSKRVLGRTALTVDTAVTALLDACVV